MKSGHSYSFYRAVYEHSMDAVLFTVPDGRILAANHAACQLFNRTEEDICKTGRGGLIDAASPGLAQLLEERKRTGRTRGELICIRGDGTRFTGEFSSSMFLDDMGELRTITLIRDISERKHLEDQLRQQANTDSLTGLNSRRYFYELAGHEFSRSKRFKAPLALLMIDVDHFKEFNDTYGHMAGDAILRTAGAVCLQTMREIDILGRFGGEEFVALLPGIDGMHALAAAERLRLALADSGVPLDAEKMLNFTVSIGVTSLLEQDDSIEAVVKRADEAMYEAKLAGRNCARSKDLTASIAA